ncbi:glycosyltransferase [Natrinema amylolyticum]|uniref:glycosyltransferase n=1 Tax=Natrinema amylolyticum TaxID=2878679 RepID=UPI001CFBFF1A|nr:glycosyltransferase [Natrinema amylolyticum]
MKVLHLPYFENNPYHHELGDALEQRGVSVQFSTGYPRDIVRTVFENGIPDVLHLHWISWFLISDNRLLSVIKATVFIAAVICAKLLGIRIVWTVHNFLEHERRDPRLERFFKRHLVRYLFDDVIVHCESAKDQLVTVYDLPHSVTSKLTTVPHGNYVDAYENRISGEGATENLGLPESATVIVFFGSIKPYKRVPELIETFSHIDEENVRLLIAGNPMNDDVARSVGAVARRDDRVETALEFVPVEEVQVYMNAADVVVLPFEDILSSGSVLLAMSFGNPIVAPRDGCLPEILADQHELLYDSDDESGLEDALERVLSTDLDELGRRNYERALTFDWDTIADRTYSVYTGRPVSPPAMTEKRTISDTTSDQ